MTTNPYDAPEMASGSNASGKVNAPAIGLIIAGAINVLATLLGVVNNLRAMMGGVAADLQPQQADALQDAGFDPAQLMQMMQGFGAVGLVLNVIQLLAAGVIIMGALKMKNLESFGLAMTAAILAMIPCISSCCLVGLPIGIWAIVVLNSADVKAAFR